MGQVKDQVGASARHPLRPSWALCPGHQVPVTPPQGHCRSGSHMPHGAFLLRAWLVPSRAAWGWPGVFSDLRPQQYFLSFSFLFLPNPNPPPH